MHLCVVRCISLILFYWKQPHGRTAVASRVSCICLFMWKMFYVLFIPGNDADGDSWLNNRTLINLSSKSRQSYILFDWTTKLWIIRDKMSNKWFKKTKLGNRIILYLTFSIYPMHLYHSADSETRVSHSSACFCKLSLWLTTNTVSGVQQLFSGEIWCRQRVNSSIQRLLGLVCPNAPMGKESPIH